MKIKGLRNSHILKTGIFNQVHYPIKTEISLKLVVQGCPHFIFVSWFSFNLLFSCIKILCRKLSIIICKINVKLLVICYLVKFTHKIRSKVRLGLGFATSKFDRRRREHLDRYVKYK